MSTGTRPPSPPAERQRERAAPPSASARAYLRNGLPAVYRETWETAGGSAVSDLESPFAMRFLKALEEVLDPIVTLLDCLPAHLDPKLAPPEALHVMALWLGLPFEEHLPRERQERLVENALEISRSRGTARGLQLLLELMFGDPDRTGDPVFVVEDGGYCVVGSAPPADHAERPEPRTFVLRWTQPIDEDRQAAVRRVVEREKPVNVTCHYQAPEHPREQVHTEVNA
jgi:phage tail-like protein